MKFLCRNCKAKYQIADEKVVGRTLRMTCQQCGEPIVVRSSSTATSRSGQIPRPLTPMTLAGTGPGALGTDFQRQIAAATQREVLPQEEWHVAINDVPVGPMRRDEVARKIAMSAIDRESLAWREGMDDWLPIKHIPELAVLFAQEHGPGAVRPPPAAGAMSGAPPAPMAAPPPPPPAGGVAPPARGEAGSMGSRPMRTVDEYSVPLASEPSVAVAPIAPEAPVAGGGKQLGWGPMFALVSGGAFILAMGAYLGVHVLAPKPVAAPAVAENAAGEAPKPGPATAEAPDPGESVIELDVQPIEGQQERAASKRSTGSTSAPAETTKKKALTAEQKEMLARMGGGLDQPGPQLRVPDDSTSRTAQVGNLTAQQLQTVVSRGRKGLQRCYETALRGSNSTETVRLDVEIEVSPNGNVTRVDASGKALPGMDDCIVRSVKMWRFPSSGEATQTRFPVVFQPGV